MPAPASGSIGSMPRCRVHLGHTGNFDAWLDWQDGENERHGLAVYIDPRRVRALGDEATRAFIPVTNAAAERDELPYTNARLTARTGGYLLELGLPSSPDRQ